MTTTLQTVLEKRVQRLDGWIESMQKISQQYSWIRLGVFLSGAMITWGAAVYLGPVVGWAAFFISVIVFLIIVICHHRLDKAIQRYRTLREIQLDLTARRNLDWKNISTPDLPKEWERKTLDIDLLLTGKFSLHRLMDTAVSQEGSLLLAEWLSQEKPMLEEISKRQKIVQELIPLVRFRDRLRLTFREVTREQLQGKKLVGWLSEPVPNDKLKKLLLVSAVFVPTNILLFFLHSYTILPPYWILTLALYGIFYFYNVKTVQPVLEQITQMDAELDKFRTLLQYLEKSPYNNRQHLAELCQPFYAEEQAPSKQLRKIKRLTAAVGIRMNPAIGLVFNLILPWDFTCAALAANYQTELAKLLPTWLETFYRLESLVSLGNYAYLNPEYTFPNLQAVHNQPVFNTKGIGHPLIPTTQKITNDFMLNELGEVILITGSNMAGKSTFIKTIGTNLCLAYAGSVVSADEFQSNPFQLHSCIQISESIIDGFSYFYAEVRCLRVLLEKLDAEDDFPLLYLIDEIFRGTNNRERLIGSRSYLKNLIGERACGFVATHDLELATLADESTHLSNFHFRDHVEDGKLVFDYKIRRGPSPTTNALKIMEMEGLPVESPSE